MIAPGPYGIENDMLDRLQTELGPLANVASGGAISAQGLSIGELALPLAVLEPGEATPLDLSSRGDHVVETQSWRVGLVVRHVADPERLRVDYSEIDPLVLGTIRALTGWQPPSGVRELRYAGRVDLIHDDPGLLEVDIDFEVYYHLSAT